MMYYLESRRKEIFSLQEEANWIGHILHNWIGHILHRNCLLNVTEGKIE